MPDLTILHVCVGALFIALGVPLIQRRVPPNPYYGFRMPKTLNNPDIWYPVNEHGGRLMVYVGIAVVGTALGLRLVPHLNADVSALGSCVVMVAGAIWMTVKSFLYLRRF